MWSDEVRQMILTGILESLYMTICSTIAGYVLGLPWGIALAVTDQDGIQPNRGIYRFLDLLANVLRSVPFLILLILIMPFTAAVVGKSYGSTATIVPLTISAAPFIARMVESSLKEVDKGVIEAAESMGAGLMTIITRVMLVEARVSLISGFTIALGTVLGYSAMAGVVGGGGLGDIAIRYGYYRRVNSIMFATVILLILLMQAFQYIGMAIGSRMDKRK